MAPPDAPLAAARRCHNEACEETSALTHMPGALLFTRRPMA